MFIKSEREASYLWHMGEIRVLRDPTQPLDAAEKLISLQPLVRLRFLMVSIPHTLYEVVSGG